MEPFLSIEDFTVEYQGALSEGEEASAERLLQVVSDHIRRLKPDADADAGAQVAFEVVRDALVYGELEKMSSFQNITSRRQEAGTFDEAAKAIDGYLTKRHRQILGIHTKPAYYFGD